MQHPFTSQEPKDPPLSQMETINKAAAIKRLIDHLAESLSHDAHNLYVPQSQKIIISQKLYK